MNIRDVKNEVIHLMDMDEYDDKRRQGIITALMTFLNSSCYTNIISIAIRNQKKDSVISISKIPCLVSIIVTCLKNADLTKMLQTNDMKYFIYGVLYNFILQEDPGFFNDISIETFENLYDGIFDILLIFPNVIDVSSQFCKILC